MMQQRRVHDSLKGVKESPMPPDMNDLLQKPIHELTDHEAMLVMLERQRSISDRVDSIQNHCTTVCSAMADRITAIERDIAQMWILWKVVAGITGVVFGGGGVISLILYLVGVI